VHVVDEGGRERKEKNVAFLTLVQNTERRRKRCQLRESVAVAEETIVLLALFPKIVPIADKEEVPNGYPGYQQRTIYPFE
jgi:hypothetical protein